MGILSSREYKNLSKDMEEELKCGNLDKYMILEHFREKNSNSWDKLPTFLQLAIVVVALIYSLNLLRYIV